MNKLLVAGLLVTSLGCSSSSTLEAPDTLQLGTGKAGSTSLPSGGAPTTDGGAAGAAATVSGGSGGETGEGGAAGGAGAAAGGQPTGATGGGTGSGGATNPYADTWPPQQFLGCKLGSYSQKPFSGEVCFQLGVHETTLTCYRTPTSNPVYSWEVSSGSGGIQTTGVRWVEHGLTIIVRPTGKPEMRLHTFFAFPSPGFMPAFEMPDGSIVSIICDN